MNTKSEYVREVTARYIGPRRKRSAVKTPAIAADFMRNLLRDDAREHFFALYLNGAHEFVSYSLIALGTANYAAVHSREVFQLALLAGSCAFIIGHNHPSGNLTPSQEDQILTKKLKECGTLLGIPLLDHVIISNTEHFSFKEQGLL